MAQSIQEAGEKTRSTEKESINGWMGDAMKATGRTTICMVMVSIRGKMAGNTKDNISKIENMDLEHLNGQIQESIKEIGNMENNMVEEFIMEAMDKKEKVNGLKGNI